jgi:hypothetical protein
MDKRILMILGIIPFFLFSCIKPSTPIAKSSEPPAASPASSAMRSIPLPEAIEYSGSHEDISCSIYQTNDSLIAQRYTEQDGGKMEKLAGIFRVEGYTEKDVGAAARQEDSLEFVVTECSKEVEVFLRERNYPSSQDDGKLIINLAVPHAYDPGHVVRNSTVENQVIVIIQIFPDIGRGGWDNSRRLMMFQKKADLDTKYFDYYPDEEYEHFYDGV